MLFECFIEGVKEISFLIHGETRWKARYKAKRFLDYWAMPTKGLLLKRFNKPKRRKNNKNQINSTLAFIPLVADNLPKRRKI